MTQLKTLGTSVLLVEQLVEKALAASSRVYVLVQGRVVLNEPASEPSLRGALEKAYLSGQQLARIMHHGSRFRTCFARARAAAPTS